MGRPSPLLVNVDCVARSAREPAFSRSVLKSPDFPAALTFAAWARFLLDAEPMRHSSPSTLSIASTTSIGVLCALLATAFGCSSSSAGGTTGTASGKDDFLSQYCAEFAPCCAKAGLPSDGAACRAVYGALTPSNYDAAAGNACLSEIRALSSSPTFCDNLGSTTGSAPSCKKVFQTTAGTVAPGGECTQDKDCAPSSEGSAKCASLYKGGTTIKKCQIQIAGKAGDSPCVGTVDGNVTSYSSSGTATDIPTKGYLCDVKDSVYCNSTSGKCTAISGVGGPCTSSYSHECAKDAYCDLSSKTCAAKKPASAACTGDQCITGTYCDDTTKVCTTQLAEGAACKTSKECLSNNCINSKCAKSGLSDLSLAFLCGSAK